MADIFICYRRIDSEGQAGRLHDHLVERFGTRSVFVDVDNLHPGQDFAQVIQNTLQRSSVVLVVIGRRWLDQRLRNEDDYVRREIAAALKGKKRVIPVLVQDAQMPAPGKLPPELAPLAGKQAIPLRHSSWKADVARLVASLQRTLARKKAADTPAKPPRKSRAPKATTTGVRGASAPAPRAYAPTAKGASETPPRKKTARRPKKPGTAAAAPSHARAADKPKEPRRAGAAPAGGRKASGAPTPPLTGSSGSEKGGSRGQKGAKAPGTQGSKKKASAVSTAPRRPARARRTP